MEKQPQKKSGKKDPQHKDDKREFEGHTFRSPEEAQKDRKTPDNFDFDKEKDYRPGQKKDH